jgi:hypothetical protein
MVLNGSYAGKYFSTSGTNSNVRQTIDNLTAGMTYDVSGWVNIPQAGSSLSLKPKVEWRNGSTLIYRDTLEKYTGVTNGWAQFSGSLVAPAGTTNARLVLAITGLDGTIYVDDFAFRPQGSTSSAPANTTAGSAFNNSQTTQSPGLRQALANSLAHLWPQITAFFGIAGN